LKYGGTSEQRTAGGHSVSPIGAADWRAPFAQCERDVPPSAVNKKTILLLGCARAVRETWSRRGTEIDKQDAFLRLARRWLSDGRVTRRFPHSLQAISPFRVGTDACPGRRFANAAFGGPTANDPCGDGETVGVMLLMARFTI